MKNLETKKLSRDQMKSVLGGSMVGGHCVSDIACSKDQYCADIEPVSGYGYCKKKVVDPSAAKVLITL
ncbi:hypothetical protein FFF34_010530 [Inquilinus sp. KBS0705]|nr:hypothetical protein FFF34_010530 [Inquilinus sp. KBS0705]